MKDIEKQCASSAAIEDRASPFRPPLWSNEGGVMNVNGVHDFSRELRASELTQRSNLKNQIRVRQVLFAPAFGIMGGQEC